MPDLIHFSSYEGHKDRRTGKICGTFSRMHRTLGGWMLARAPASPAQGLHHHGPRYFNYPYFCTMCGLEKLVLVDQNWLERILSALLLRTLVVGRRQQSESIEVALDFMELCVVFFTLTDRASTIYPVLYVVANPVRGLLDRKRSEEHLPSSIMRAKEKHKQTRQRERNKDHSKIHMPEKDRVRRFDEPF